MKSHLTFEDWAQDRAHKPLVTALTRLLVEARTGQGANDLVQEFRKEGYADQVESWIRQGPGAKISPQDVGRVLGDEIIDDLAVDAKIPLDETQALLSVILPEFISLLAPEGWWDAASAQDTLVGYLQVLSTMNGHL
jgi:uncharacterized protein YidB (DUF937 family)